MLPANMPAVLEIEKDCYTRPWTEDEWRRARRRKDCLSFVIEHGGDEPTINRPPVAGYGIYRLKKTSMELIDLAVRPADRLKGAGRAGLAFTKKHLGERDCITCRIRESNLDGHLFLKASGFTAGWVLRGYFDDTNEDAYHFVWRPVR
jgi:ribosomal protein S18 acetylase RimI-like enzyme